jgi:hypothetical protein
MGQINLFKKGDSKEVAFPRPELARGFSENQIIPIKLSGVLMPWERKLDAGAGSDFKLVCSSGLEYYFVVDQVWSNVLRWYSWEDIKVIGLLNTSSHTLIPQKVYPKRPTGEREKAFDLAKWKSRVNINQFAENLNHLFLIPAAFAEAAA